MRTRIIGLAVALCLLGIPAFAQVPDYGRVAQQVFDSRPADVVMLRQLCDQTDSLRNQFGADDPRVQDGVERVNAIKGMFTRRIAYAVHQVDQRFGLRRKDIGARAIRPNDGLSLATDVVLWRDTGQVIDVMSDRNPSWGVTPGDVQPIDQWTLPLPELNDAPVPAPVPVPQPPVVLPPVYVPPVQHGTDYTELLSRIIELQQMQILKIDETLLVVKDTSEHVKNMDRTLTQTLGSASKFIGKYIAPAIGGWYIAHLAKDTKPATTQN